jgi:hypothetical protein
MFPFNWTKKSFKESKGLVTQTKCRCLRMLSILQIVVLPSGCNDQRSAPSQNVTGPVERLMANLDMMGLGKYKVVYHEETPLCMWQAAADTIGRGFQGVYVPRQWYRSS